MTTLGQTLGRWHEWRRGWSPERGYARAPALAGDHNDADEELDRLLFHAIDDEVAALPLQQQLAIAHVARAECLGVEVIHLQALPRGAALDALVAESVAALQKRLLQAGVAI